MNSKSKIMMKLSRKERRSGKLGTTKERENLFSSFSKCSILWEISYLQPKATLSN
jgi:hypothetical protein